VCMFMCIERKRYWKNEYSLRCKLLTHTIETYHGTHHTGLLEERIRRKLCLCTGHPAGWSSDVSVSVHVHVSVCTHNTG
jgi:hypothetical protein